MNIEEIREFCLSKTASTESLPFDDFSLVFKVAGKIFAILSIDDHKSINLKCNPEKAIELRDKYVFVLPGYHMNKTHWNTIDLNYSISDSLLTEMINDSYALVCQSLPNKLKQEFNFSL